MKATKILFAAAAFVATAFPTNAQSLFVKQTDGTVHEYAVDNVQEILFGASTENLGIVSISYIANGSADADITQQGIEGKVFTIGKDVNFTAPANKEFAGWNTAADGSGVQCADGEMVSLSRSLMLYAQWQDKPNTDNGHEWVDLGLSVKWATCNVGATKPEEFGYYFAWGEIQPKSDYSWSTYKYGSASTQLTKYCIHSGLGKDGFTDDKIVLDPEDDAARQNLGGNWRMPTYAEIRELVDSENCVWNWKTLNGVEGAEVKSKINGNSIFLPAAGYIYGTDLLSVGPYGYIWTASLLESSSYCADLMDFCSDKPNCYNYYRCYGIPVRPVCP